MMELVETWLGLLEADVRIVKEDAQDVQNQVQMNTTGSDRLVACVRAAESSISMGRALVLRPSCYLLCKKRSKARMSSC